MLKDRSSFLEFNICYCKDKYKKKKNNPPPKQYDRWVQQDQMERLTIKRSMSEHFADPEAALACLNQG